MITEYGTPRLSPISYEVLQFNNAVEDHAVYINCCNVCGKVHCKGISDVATGRSKCIDCMVSDYADTLENDSEWIKRERIWRIRQARAKREAKEEMERNRLIEVNEMIPEEEKPRLAKIFYDMLENKE
jgi:hypothetical protein